MTALVTTHNHWKTIHEKTNIYLHFRFIAHCLYR